MTNTKDMTLEQALDEILDVEPPLKKAAVACIRANREKAIPELLQRMEDIYDEAKNGNVDEFTDYHWYPMYLLAEFREPALFPLLLQMLRLDSENFDSVFGDCYHDDYPRVLASCGTADQLPMLRELALDTNIYVFQRLVAVETACIWFAHDMLDRDSHIAFIREMIIATAHEADKEMISFVVISAMETGLTELQPMVQRLFDEELIDEMLIGKWKDVQKDFANPARALREYKQERFHQLVHDGLKLFDHWSIYSEDKPLPIEKQLAKQKKVGQNDPCPCGSGKKYKKCCFLNE